MKVKKQRQNGDNGEAEFDSQELCSNLAFAPLAFSNASSLQLAYGAKVIINTKKLQSFSSLHSLTITSLRLI